MEESPIQQVLYPNDLPLLRLRLTYRMLQSGPLPRFKGSMLRGGFGYAFQHTTCPDRCWGRAEQCAEPVICPYRAVFEPERPAHAQHFYDLKDAPRPFVIDLPIDERTFIEAGESLEFGLTLIGSGIDFLPYFLYCFARLGEMGLGAQRLQASLEHVVALAGWQSPGRTIYANGIMQADQHLEAYIQQAEILQRAQQLPDRLQLHIRLPLRIKSAGQILGRFELAALIQSLCWRLSALNAFYGHDDWQLNGGIQAALAGQSTAQQQTRWEDLDRYSDHRGSRERVSLSGIVGHVQLRQVPLETRTLLLIGQLIHVGKSCVFGSGSYAISADEG